VEKHRNGPVGRVELFFDDKLGAFMDLDKGNLNGFAAMANSQISRQGGIDGF
jgi:hypothetical protein